MANKLNNNSRLRSRSDFTRLFSKGSRAYSSNWLVLNYMPNAQEQSRYGWTVPKFVGTAVVRNRLKRWSRVLVKDQKILKGDYDVNVVFRRQNKEFYKKLRYGDFEKGLTTALHKISRHSSSK